MGKKSGKLFKEKINRIEQARKAMEKESKRLVVECSHQNENGKLKLYPVSDHGDYECKYCHTRFNMNKINFNDLKSSIEVVHNAIQQIRCYSDSDSEKDAQLIRVLGELDFNVHEVAELYDRIVRVYGKGNGKKKHHNRDSNDGFGGFGSAASISFIGGNKRRF